MNEKLEDIKFKFNIYKRNFDFFFLKDRFKY